MFHFPSSLQIEAVEETNSIAVDVKLRAAFTQRHRVHAWLGHALDLSLLLPLVAVVRCLSCFLLPYKLWLFLSTQVCLQQTSVSASARVRTKVINHGPSCAMVWL